MNGFGVRLTASLALLLTLVVASVAACGAQHGGDQPGKPGGSDAGAGDVVVSPLGGDTGSGMLSGPNLVGITVTPAQASLVLLNGAVMQQVFTATAAFSDGTSSALTTGIQWTVDNSPVGTMAGGLYTPSGTVGGVVHVSASYQGQTGLAQLTVKLHLTDNPANAPPSSQTALTGATMQDPTVVWAYPYNGTVFPRGLGAPLFMWNNATSGDLYYVHITSATFEYETFASADPTMVGALAGSQYTPTETVWDAFVNSTNGAATLTVARLTAANAATVVTQLGWTIAPASLRGTVYYWANSLGHVLRIQPGAAAPDDFANNANLASYQPTASTPSCLMTCHTVSADGSVLVSGGGVYAGSYDLKADKPMFSLGGTWDVPTNNAGQPEWQNIQWYQPALSPTGTYVLSNSMGQGGIIATSAPAGTNIMNLFTTQDGMPVANSGVAGTPFAEPAWSPDGTLVAFVDSGDPSTWTGPSVNWQRPPPGDLKVMQFNAAQSPMFSPPVDLVAVGTANQITWPTISPDSKWVVYSRAGSADTRFGPSGAAGSGFGDLYMASAVMPNQEVRLATLDGDGYPFAAGTRDLSLNFEPTFAPVASGGYFWVVFTSRRTYGNLAPLDPSEPSTATKQLWVAAIDQIVSGGENGNPTLLMDPSHPPFRLPGQDPTSLNMRGFFSLPPCATDGVSCNQGTDCCGGYCVTPSAVDAGADGGGGLTCAHMPNGCSQNGDRCTTNSDCCGASDGVTCINSVCSEPTPQ